MNAQRLEEIRARLEATRSVSWLPLENYSIIAQQQQDIADLLDDNDVLRARVAELEREHKRVLMAVAEAIRPGYIDVEEYYKEDEDEQRAEIRTAQALLIATLEAENEALAQDFNTLSRSLKTAEIEHKRALAELEAYRSEACQ